MKKFIVYRTTNIVNGKVYIGVHKQENPDVFDGYLGSGNLLRLAIKKYGKQMFVRENLHVHESKTEAYIEEAQLVDNLFVERSDSYNLKCGGYGGWPPTAGKNAAEVLRGSSLSVLHRIKVSKSLKGRKFTTAHKHLIGEANKLRVWSDDSKVKMSKSKQGQGIGRKHSSETKQQRGEKQLGTNNSFYGKHHTSEMRKVISDKNKKLKYVCRITGNVVERRRVPEDIVSEFLSDGWCLGRKLKEVKT